METALQTIESRIVNVEEFAMTPDRIVKQVKLIQEVMEKVMKKDEHFGIIPGCKKPSLYKPGAEKLSVTFRLVPKYEIHQSDLSNGHREYQVVCTLVHAPSGQFFGQGVGSCSTMEGKYRFRTGEVKLSGKPVPQEYWTKRDQNLIGGKGFSVKKIDGKWQIVEAGEKVEHDNPADHYNTVLKMAKKRAHVDAVLTATAASDIFTQDVEDLPSNEPIEDGEEPPILAEQVESAPPPKQEPKKSKYDFLKIMSDFKAQLGLELYYQILGAHGVEHANEITERKAQEAVYRDMAIEAKKREEK